MEAAFRFLSFSVITRLKFRLYSSAFAMTLPRPSSSPITYTTHYSSVSPFRRRPMACLHRPRRKDKILVLLGATGSGKSALSIGLASLFPSEIINSDKIQLYHGLDITTNKIPVADRRSVPHHLIGHFHSDAGDITPSDFRSLAALAVSSISSRRNLPLLVGGSNSFVHALLVDRYDPGADMFSGSDPVSSELRYDCCFIWVDVSFAVLAEYLSKRVDDMLGSGMFEELAGFYDPDEDSRAGSGLRKAIGVPEFNKYFRKYPPSSGRLGNESVRVRAYEEAVREIKDNTCELVKRQLGKIQRLREAGWDLQRVDATEAFRAILAAESERRWSEIWETRVLEPSVKIVNRFLNQ